jgi:NADP-dependent 3-hydroxy acid dehydrogenase YdfG
MIPDHPIVLTGAASGIGDATAPRTTLSLINAQGQAPRCYTNSNA